MSEPTLEQPFVDGAVSDSGEAPLPVRPRRRLLTPVTALLFALLVGAGGFLAGVAVQKDQTSSSADSGSSGLASAGGRRGGSGGFPGLVAGRGAATTGAGVTAGQVSTIDGGTLSVTDTQGNTIKVTTGAAPAVTKTVTRGISVSQIHPGDTIVVQGTRALDGSLSATSIRDSGAGGSGPGALFGGAGGGSAGAGGSFGGGGATSGGGGGNRGGAGGPALFGG